MANEITFQDVLTTSSTQQFALGQRAELPDGRKFVYVKNITAALTAKGMVGIQGASVGVDTVSSSADNQGRKVYITEASAGWTVGDYADDWVLVDDGTGEGQVAKIKTNTADTLILYPEYALTTALDVADSDITIVRPYHVTIAAVTSKKQGAVGICQVAFTLNYYGWLQTYGVGTVLAGEVITTSANFTTGDNTTGTVKIGATTEGAFDAQNLGYSLEANTTADKNLVAFINIQ